MTVIENELRHALIGYFLDQIAAAKSGLDAIGYRPTTPEERAAAQDSEASDYHAAVVAEDGVTG